MHKQTIKNGNLAAKAKLEKELCDPPHHEVLQICKKLPFGAPNPKINLEFPESITIGIPCAPKTCTCFTHLKSLNLYVVLFVLLWILSFYTVKKCFDMRLHHLQLYMS